ncbi:MAG: M36 family metallopeptidase [Cytophagales bacterium]
MMKKTLLSLIAIVVFILSTEAQEQKQEISEYLNSYAQKSALSIEDIANWEITDNYVDKRNGIRFVYIRQTIKGIPVQNGLANFAIKNGEVAYMGDRLISDLEKNLPSSNPSIGAETAINRAAEQLDIEAPNGLNLIRTESDKKFIYSSGGISLENIPVELMYLKAEDDKTHLVWNLSIYELSAQNWWSVSIDAHNGALLNKVNWVTHCEFGHSHENDGSFSEEHLSHSTSSSKLTSSDYKVIALPAESPNHGPYVTVSNPSDSLASPFGWHDTDGLPGAEFTITRGNNVHAYEDLDGSNNNNPGTSPDGTSALHFDFPYTPGTAPSSYTDAATTNLFYLNNLMHDIWYYYGFDEASGNFQVNNYGRGGIGGDDVRAEAQDGGGTNNANFATPSDGNRPRMQMYLWGSGNSARDGDFDNGIIAHEYGHGISNRLTGGPSLSGCLSNAEQMGEGWSDWFGLMITIDSGDQATDRRGIGTFAQGAPTTGNGIRPAPYTTDFSINNYTYGNTNSGLSQPHGIGFVFATALWDLNWALINLYGGVADPDLYTGTGGNNITMNLVMMGMKLQPCSPGMIDGRDAIIAADDLLYNGIHKCLIWDVFANRGFGYFAQQGSPNSRSDQTEDFNPSPFCQTATQAPIANFGFNPIAPACKGDVNFIDSSLNLAQQWFWSFGDGTTDTFPNPKHSYLNAGTYTVQLVVTNNIGSDTISKTVTVGQPLPPVVLDKEICEGANAVLVASNAEGTIEWFDSGINLQATGPIYIRSNVTSDEVLLVRDNRSGPGSFCISAFDSVYIKVLKSDFTYSQNGATVSFTDASSHANAWSWNFGDGNSSTLQNPTHTYSAGGNYNVQLSINGRPCSKTEVVSIISGIEDENGFEKFSLYPNPSKGTVNINLTEAARADLHYSIQDLSGKILMRSTIEKGEKSVFIKLKDFEPAMYLIQIEGDDFNEIRKLLLE